MKRNLAKPLDPHLLPNLLGGIQPAGQVGGRTGRQRSPALAEHQTEVVLLRQLQVLVNQKVMLDTAAIDYTNSNNLPSTGA